MHPTKSNLASIKT